jgi:hypothetical protein
MHSAAVHISHQYSNRVPTARAGQSIEMTAEIWRGAR